MNSFDELYVGFLNFLLDGIERKREIIDVEYEDLSDEIQQPSNSIEFPNAELISQTRPHPKSISEWERDIICSQMGIRFSAPETILKINI